MSDRLTRRALLLAAVAAPLALPGAASAALKLPTRISPPRVRPLGTWRILNARPETEQGVPAIVELSFRSDIDVEEPNINWWPRSIPVAPLPPGARPAPGLPFIPTPIPRGTPRRPNDQPLGERLSGNLMSPIFIRVDVGSGTCPGGYRVTCEMADPVSGRKATFTFLLRVLGAACPRPTGIPHPTATPRYPPRLPTRTPVP